MGDQEDRRHHHHRLCELCQRRAAVYCCADEAYVCWDCDSKVHSANFIVARHFRSVLCGRCEAPTSALASSLIAHSAQNPQIAPLCCPTCDSSTDLDRLPWDAHLQSVHSEQSTTQETGNGEEEVTSSSTMNSNGATSITSSAMKSSGKRRSRSPSPDSVIPEAGSVRKRSKDQEAEITRVTEERLEQILRQWNRQLGIDQSSSRVVSLAMQLLRRIAGSIRSNHLEKLDARAALAVCFWMALKLECSSLRRRKNKNKNKFPSSSSSSPPTSASSSSSHSSSSPPSAPPSNPQPAPPQDHSSAPFFSGSGSGSGSGSSSSSSSVAMVPRLDKFERCTGVSAEVLLSVEAKLCQALHSSTHT